MSSSSSHIYFLLDASSSMKPRQQTVVSAINEFLEEQKNLGPCLVSLFSFSRQVQSIFENKDIHSVSLLTVNDYRPCGTTALWDAMGSVLQQIPTLPNDQVESSSIKRILVVLTDGEENSSFKYRPIDLKTRIQELGSSLEIVYVGSNQDAVLNGQDVGSDRDSSLEYADHKLPQALRSTSNAVRRYRNNLTPNVQFTYCERQTSV